MSQAKVWHIAKELPELTEYFKIYTLQSGESKLNSCLVIAVAVQYSETISTYMRYYTLKNMTKFQF